VLTRCGIQESELLWVIDSEGSFLFGRPSDAAPPLEAAKSECLMTWVDKERVSNGPVGVGAVR